MALRDYSTGRLHLCSIPRRSAAWAATIMDKPSTYFAKCEGSALFAPTRSMPSSEVGEYKVVEGTRIDGYSSALDVLLWQFGRDWMGHPQENYTLLAAPQEDVFHVLHGDIYLVQSFDEIVQGLPDDCNVHWRSFPQREQKAFERLLLFLRQTEIVAPNGEILSPAQSFLEKHALPIAHTRASTLHWGRGDSLLQIEQRPDTSLIVRFATVFSVLYGFDTDDD